MKIAFITDDGEKISRHFGRAPYYLVIEVENGEEIGRELREKLGHNHFAAQEDHSEHKHDHDHNHEHSGMHSHAKHQSMAEAISDCDALICGGMGMGAYQSMQSLGIPPLVTDQSDIAGALKAYLAGELPDRTDMLH